MSQKYLENKRFQGSSLRSELLNNIDSAIEDINFVYELDTKVIENLDESGFDKLENGDLERLYNHLKDAFEIMTGVKHTGRR